MIWQSFVSCFVEVGCEPNTCKNGGKCVVLPEEDIGAYKCECQEPFYGTQCEHKFTGELISNPRDAAVTACMDDQFTGGEKLNTAMQYCLVYKIYNIVIGTFGEQQPVMC
jgi:hypothetical protein